MAIPTMSVRYAISNVLHIYYTLCSLVPGLTLTGDKYLKAEVS